LSAWLLKEIDVDVIEWGEFDDPSVIVNSISREIKTLGFRADFPESKLRKGSGDAVCAVLSFLADKALAKKKWTVQSPVYTKSEFAEEAVVDEDAEVADGGSDVEEAAGVEEDADGDANDYFAPKMDRDEDEKEDMKMLEAKVDPAEWKLELERVGPKLRFKADAASKEWRTHIEQSQKHETQIQESFPDAKIALDKIGKELRSAIDRISAKERNINKDFDTLGVEFREKQKLLDEIQEQYNGLSKQVSEATKTLGEKTDSVELIKSQMNNQNNSMTDTSPLRKIQTALSELRKEVGAMELRIGVVAQTLLSAKIKAQTTAHQQASAKAKRDSEPMF
jgi:estrogen-related receptor beta like 1